MSDISFNCLVCNQPLEAPAEYAGQVIECPACQKETTVPVSGPVQEEAGGVKCPECKAVLEEGVVLCVQCGFHTKLGKKIVTDFK